MTATQNPKGRSNGFVAHVHPETYQASDPLQERLLHLHTKKADCALAMCTFNDLTAEGRQEVIADAKALRAEVSAASRAEKAIARGKVPAAKVVSLAEKRAGKKAPAAAKAPAKKAPAKKAEKAPRGESPTAMHRESPFPGGAVYYNQPRDRWYANLRVTADGGKAKPKVVTCRSREDALAALETLRAENGGAK